MNRILVVTNTTGSVEHYYHFFFAALVPLLDRARAGNLAGTSWIRDCGPMNSHLESIERAGLARFQIVDWRQLQVFCTRAAKAQIIQLHSEECYTVTGLRDDGYQPQILKRVAHFGISHFAPEPPNIDVLLIERGSPNPFYLSHKSAITGSANTRRSIPNLDAVQSALETSGRAVTRVHLEQASLPEQIRLFAGAKTVIAQHGAALANIIWMKPTSNIIEIIPLTQNRREHFFRLARIMGIKYQPIAQTDNHAPVQVERVVQAANA